MEEQQQIDRAMKGDEHALACLLHDHYSFLMKYLVKVTMDPIAAEDLTQDTMLKCVEKIHLYNGRSKFSSWLITIATRLYIDAMRRKKLERQWRFRQYSEQRPHQLMQWQVTGAGGQWSEALEAMAMISYEVRLPILLKHYYGYSYDEIADMLHIPAGTVKSRIYNGLKQIRKELE